MKPPSPLLAEIRCDIDGIAWPPVAQGQAAVLAAMLYQLEDSQWLAREELLARQFDQLGVLAEFCETWSPQFRRRLGEAGLTAADLASPEGLRRLPPLSRRAVQLGGDLFCTEVPAAHAPLGEARTSGSTGEPVTVRRTAVSNFDWGVLTLRENLWHRRDVTRPFCAIRGQIKAPVRLPSWGAPTSLLFATGPSLGLPVTMDTDTQIAAIAEFGPESLLAYPSTLERILRRCEERGTRLPTVKNVRTIGESVTPDLRTGIARVLSASVTDNYSSQEIGVIACECPDAPLYHVMEPVLVEILDPAGNPVKEGETGRIIVTDLHNFATPLIRYDIGDYAEAGPPCSCGRGLPTLARILGRERNHVLLPDGTLYWPLMGADYFTLRDIAPVRQYQIIQRDRTRMELRLVSDAKLTRAQEDEVRGLIARIFRHPFEAGFTYFEKEIPKGANGKFEIFYSEAR